MNTMPSLRNVLLAEQEPKTGAYLFCSDSNLFPGHEKRMAAHMARVRAYPCVCGSDVPFGCCCLGKRRCERCHKTYVPCDDMPDDCPFCGSDHTFALFLQEVCG